MKPFRLPLLIAVLLGACTSAPPPAAPAPLPDAPRAERVEAPPEADAPPVAPTDGVPADAAPARWWLGPADATSPGSGVDAAYAELLAGREPRRTVVVGVIDSGVDIAHEDLVGSLWVNPGEIAGNGVDDDGNGYVDDVHGWNFIGGPDGRNIEDDTYEVTRLYAACEAIVGGGGGERVVAGTSCDEVESVFDERRAGAAEMLGEIRMMRAAVDGAFTVLRRELGRDSLTMARVRSLVPMSRDVRQAQQIYYQLASLGITQPMIADEEARLERLLERGLNPSFDPRPIVGDDYDDLHERHYGNADVTGPDASHGTGVAGIIAAGRDNGIGEDGIAPARIMVLRAVPDGDERDKDVANAIRYAVDHGAHIINMSFGKGFSPGKRAVDAAVRYAEERGVLIVHAAGNEGDDLGTAPNFPTRRYDDGTEAGNWLVVGASSWRGGGALAAEFSNYGGARVDVFAPGVDITAAAPGGGSQTASGTSFAAPVVAGLAALIMAYHPELSAMDVRRIILETARPYGSTMVARPGSEGERVPFGELSATGAIVDARAALELAERTAAARRN